MIIFQKKLFFLITFLLTSNFLFADPCSLPENTISLDGGDVWYNVNTDIAGFEKSLSHINYAVKTMKNMCKSDRSN